MFLNITYFEMQYNTVDLKKNVYLLYNRHVAMIITDDKWFNWITW